MNAKLSHHVLRAKTISFSKDFDGRFRGEFDARFRVRMLGCNEDQGMRNMGALGEVRGQAGDPHQLVHAGSRTRLSQNTDGLVVCTCQNVSWNSIEDFEPTFPVGGLRETMRYPFQFVFRPQGHEKVLRTRGFLEVVHEISPRISR